MKLRVSLLAFTCVAVAACGTSAESGDGGSYETVDKESLEILRERLDSNGVDYTRTHRRGMPGIEWSQSDNAEIWKEICQIFPPGPPMGRSLSFEEDSMTDQAKSALEDAGIATETIVSYGQKYVVWTTESLNADVERVLLSALGWSVRVPNDERTKALQRESRLCCLGRNELLQNEQAAYRRRCISDL